MSQVEVDKYNELIMESLSSYLNFNADFIKGDIIEKLSVSCRLGRAEAYALILAEVLGLDLESNHVHKEIYEKYFKEMIHELDVKKYKNNLYYKNITVPKVQGDFWQFKMEKYKPYELFVYNDLKRMKDGRIIPQLGFFNCEFEYPAVLQGKREWMLITPNEIETMRKAVDEAQGKVLTFGLGLGYYAYMVSEKENVSSITIVEKDEEIIKLFEKYILTQFRYKNKIEIIKDDAFNYAESNMKGFDFVFTDLWHDPADGVDIYLKMKEYEKKNPEEKFSYWIEDTLLCYL